jgi:predicted nucleic acid-binding protein
VKSLISRHKIIAVDTSIFIYHFEGNPSYTRLTTLVLDRIQFGKCRGIASELTLHELVVRPLQLGLPDVADEYELLLSSFPNMTLTPVTRPILLKAAELRAAYGFRAPDAIIIATAIINRATLLVTNDKKWQRIKELTVACLDDFNV